MIDLHVVGWHDFLNLRIQTIIMDNTNGTAATKRTRKDFRKLVAARIETALQDLQNDMKEKKFKAAVKRASKLLANDLYVKNKKDKTRKEEATTIVEAETIGA